MPTFSYDAYDDSGKRISGEIEAANERQALDQLARNRCFATRIEQKAAAAGTPWWDRELFPSRLGSASLALFTRELATLVKAALPLDEALRIIAVQPLLPARTRALATAIEQRLASGSSLSEAMATDGQMFPEHYWRLVRAGETSGRLAETLENLATFSERSAAFTAKISGALLYPAVVLSAAAVSLSIIVAVLVPAIAPLFSDAGVAPPAIIGALIGAQRTMSDNALTLAALALAAAGTGVLLWRRDAVADWRHETMLRLPVFGALIRQRETARLARTLSMMLETGVPLLDGLDITRRVLSNRTYQRAVADVSTAVAGGTSLAASLAAARVFPEVAVRLVTVGERTGRLGAMLARVADIHESGVERGLERISTLIAPLSTVLIGFVVGGLVLSVLQAVVSVNELAFR